MTRQGIQEYDRKSLQKIEKLRLPHIYKRIGIGIAVVTFIGMFINAFTMNIPELKIIMKYGILVGLLIASISREKVEDELIINLKMKSYTFAFIVAVFFTLMTPLIDYIVDVVLANGAPTLEEVGDWEILWMLLSIQIFYFEYLKRMHR